MQPDSILIIEQFVKIQPFPCCITDIQNNIIFSNEHFSKNINKNYNSTEKGIFESYKKESLVVNNTEYYYYYKLNSEIEFHSLIHDLSNIFTNITNLFNKVVLPNSKGSDSKYIKNLSKSIERANNIISSKLKHGTLSLPRKKININELLEEVSSFFLNSLCDKIEFTYHIQQESIFIYADPGEIYRVILNILINASEAIPEKGKIILKSQIIENKIHIFISDTGLGINPSDLDNIFLEGFSTKQKQRISGIGLNTSKKIINHYKGFINVKSQLTQGTEFEIIFPILTQEENSLNTILIVEDEEIIRELLSDLLTENNFNVICAENYNDGLRLFENNMINLAIIDKKLPDKNGTELIKYIKYQNPDIPVILASGSIEADESEIDLDIKYRLTKPYNFDELINLINFILIS